MNFGLVAKHIVDKYTVDSNDPILRMAQYFPKTISPTSRPNVALLRLAYKFGAIVSLGVASLPVYSQTNEGVSIGIGESNFLPSIRFEYAQESNAIRRDANEIENISAIVKPELLWNANKGSTSVELKYNGDFSVGDVDQLDYLDHLLGVELSSVLNKRSRLRANARVAFDHFELGSDVFTRISPAGLEQVEFSQQGVDIEYTYGAERAKGQFIGKITFDNLDYLNNDALTRNSSRTLLRPSIAFSYRLSGDTRGFVSAAVQHVDRAADGGDRTDFDLAFGASWEVTGRTGGAVSFGLGQSSLDSADDINDFVADIGFYYEPRSFSRFDLVLKRSFFNNGLGSTAEVAILNALRIGWRYDWSSRVFHKAAASVQSLERACPEVGDQTVNLSLEISVQVRRWIVVGFGVDAEDRQNDFCNNVALNDLAPDYENLDAFAFMKFSL